jgi:hypothetical protein
MSSEMSDGHPAPQQLSRGRPFAPGNPGRRPGSKNKTTRVAEALLWGEEAELVRKAIELAKAGNVPMLKFLLDRILPKQRRIELELPEVNFASDVVDALGAVFNAAANAEIAPREGAEFAMLLGAYARAINLADHERRLEAIEATLEQIR